MRLTCPNCDAQYEVPDEVIPPEGRDVQCSNCGDTWFQTSGETGVAASNPPADSTFYDDEDYDDSDEIDAQYQDSPQPTADRPAQQPTSTQTSLNPSVKDILREEAELESQIRAEESGNTLESQPDLGLDDLADETQQRAQDAQDRVARIRGTDPDAPADADPISLPDSRRGLLPNIEEINSTLRADSDMSDTSTALSSVVIKSSSKEKSKSNFVRGFAVAIVIATVMAMIYANAPRIAQQFPQADPALNVYVTSVGKMRLWLDAKIGDLVPETSN